jgi:hypothetical protein
MVFSKNWQNRMTALRILLAVLLVCVLILLLTRGGFVWITEAAALALIAESILLHSARFCLRRAVPVLFFCVVLAVLEWLAHHVVSTLAIKTFASYLIVQLCVRIVPWSAATQYVRPQSCLFPLILYLLFVRHFVLVLRDESVRSLTAWRISAPYLLRRGGLRSLVFSLDAFIRRCLTRSEHFYAAQLLRGLAE